MHNSFPWDVDARPFDPIDELVQRWSSVVVPIFAGSVRSDQVADGIGSAFLVVLNSRLFLLTAEHVVLVAKGKIGVLANIHGKAVLLNGLSFCCISEYDIAAVELTDDWLCANELVSLKALPAPGSEKHWQRTGVFLLAGYPASKNKLDLRYGRVDRHMRTITVEEQLHSKITERVVDGRIFMYDHENVIDSELCELGAQVGLHGMSGGPCFEILMSPYENGERRFSLGCAGVLCEWHKDKRLVVAAPPEAIVAVCLFLIGGTGNEINAQALSPSRE